MGATVQLRYMRMLLAAILVMLLAKCNLDGWRPDMTDMGMSFNGRTTVLQAVDGGSIPPFSTKFQ